MCSNNFVMGLAEGLEAHLESTLACCEAQGQTVLNEESGNHAKIVEKAGDGRWDNSGRKIQSSFFV